MSCHHPGSVECADCPSPDPSPEFMRKALDGQKRALLAEVLTLRAGGKDSAEALDRHDVLSPTLLCDAMTKLQWNWDKLPYIVIRLNRYSFRQLCADKGFVEMLKAARPCLNCLNDLQIHLVRKWLFVIQETDQPIDTNKVQVVELLHAYADDVSVRIEHR